VHVKIARNDAFTHDTGAAGAQPDRDLKAVIACATVDERPAPMRVLSTA